MAKKDNLNTNNNTNKNAKQMNSIHFSNNSCFSESRGVIVFLRSSKINLM